MADNESAKLLSICLQYEDMVHIWVLGPMWPVEHAIPQFSFPVLHHHQ
jgi:hypothetical protein